MSPDIPPEAEVIRLAREAMDMTAQSAAEASRAHDGKGVSAAYWRDVERGYGGRRGQRVPTRASARALAAMARVVGIEPALLARAGREDAARVLEEVLRREAGVFARVMALAVPPEPEYEDEDTQPVLSAVTSNVVLAAINPHERALWEEIHAYPEGTRADVIFTDPVEAALFAREHDATGAEVPEIQRIREILALRSVRVRPPRREARQAG